jgi:hypothetical protein
MSSTISQFKTTSPVRYFDCEPDIFVKRSEIPESLLVGEANTFGWDIVNVVRLPEVNQSLSDYPPPPPFEFSLQEDWHIAGEFSNWSVVRGGSGSIVLMNIPFRRSVMHYGDSITLDLKDISAVIQIKLKYVPTPPDGYVAGQPVEAGEPQYLIVNPDSRGIDDPAVIIQSVDFGKATPTALEAAMYQSALQSYLQANIHLFTYIFAIATVNATARDEVFQWLKATSTNYAYANGATDQTSYLAVLGMTQGRSRSGLSNQVSLAAIPPRSNASLVISNAMFLENLVLPAIPKALSDASESDFILADNDSIIENRGDVPLPEIDIDSDTYQPQLKSFVFQLIGDEIQVHSKVQTNIRQGVDVFVESTNFYRLRLVKSAKGGLTLDFFKSRNARVNSWYEKSRGALITEFLTQLIDQLKTAVADKTIEISSEEIIAATLIVALEGIEAAEKDLIREVMNGKAGEVLPDISSFVRAGSGNAQWGQMSGFVPQSAELNGALVFGGMVNPV